MMDLFVPDYSKYSKKELMKIYLSIDKEKEPELANLIKETMIMKTDEESPEFEKRRFSLPLFFDFFTGRRDLLTTIILSLALVTIIINTINSLISGNSSPLPLISQIIAFILLALSAFKSITGIVMLIFFIGFQLYMIFS